MDSFSQTFPSQGIYIHHKQEFMKVVVFLFFELNANVLMWKQDRVYSVHHAQVIFVTSGNKDFGGGAVVVVAFSQQEGPRFKSNG